ncbi:MAG: hypothetical protein O6851_09810 [Gemmatimonadetes bacterium]|nr:hypothetical protein [Gemmatimonadota bacterium]
MIRTQISLERDMYEEAKKEAERQGGLLRRARPPGFGQGPSGRLIG